MSQKSIIATILFIIGIIVNFVTVLSYLNFNSENPEHIARAIGMVLPGIIMAVIVGLVVGLIIHLFSKERTKDKFFLTFSILFLLTILIIAYGTSENHKLDNAPLNISEVRAVQ